MTVSRATSLSFVVYVMYLPCDGGVCDRRPSVRIPSRHRQGCCEAVNQANVLLALSTSNEITGCV